MARTGNLGAIATGLAVVLAVALLALLATVNKPCLQA